MTRLVFADRGLVRHLHKEYQEPFVLEPTKFRRLVDTIHARFRDVAEAVPQDLFEVFLAGGQREHATTLEQVLELPNSRRQRIERVVVASSVSPPGPQRPDHEIQVDFAAAKTGSSDTKVIALTVRSENAAWGATALSEAEEQIERTWQRHTPPKLTLVALLVLIAVFVVAQLPRHPSAPQSSLMWLKESDLQHVDSMLRGGRTLTEQHVRELLTIQLRNLVESQTPPAVITGPQAKRLVILAIPGVVIIACALVLLTTCYPRRVYLWGDEVERFNSMLRRRKTLWGIITGVTVVGAAAGLLSESISTWIVQRQ